MPNTRGKTIPIAMRIPVDVFNTIDRRIKKSGKFGKVQDYVKQLTIWYVRRKHGAS